MATNKNHPITTQQPIEISLPDKHIVWLHPEGTGELLPGQVDRHHLSRPEHLEGEYSIMVNATGYSSRDQAFQPIDTLSICLSTNRN